MKEGKRACPGYEYLQFCVDEDGWSRWNRLGGADFLKILTVKDRWTQKFGGAL